MSDQQNPASEDPSPFDVLMVSDAAAVDAAPSFATAFRGYDKDQVDVAFARLIARRQSDRKELASLEERYQHVSEAAAETARATTDRQAELDRLRTELDAARAEVEAARDEAAQAGSEERERIAELEAELAAATAKTADADKRVQALTAELTESAGDSERSPHFDEILRVAEEQASVIVRNAAIQAERLLEAARDEAQTRRADADAEAEAIRTRAEHDAQQARLKIDTEVMAHEARLEREGAHAAERLAQAEREAAAIRAESEKGAAALRSMVARETSLARNEAEEAVRELRVRTLEFEESLTRRQDDAQQEFLVLHNQAVAHAERITQDANEQVAASLEHAQRVSAKADDFDRLMRAQAQQIEADAHVRAREHVERARAKAQKIIDTVTGHTNAVLRDAEDRTRQLRWQQQQLTSFMAEVRELIRPEAGVPSASEDVDAVIPLRETADASSDADADASTDADADAEWDDDADDDDTEDDAFEESDDEADGDEDDATSRAS